MQLISEVYHMMREVLGMTPDEMAEVFADWNRGELESYLVEITADILRVKDEDGSPLIDNILDAAGQKGTGKWTAQNALEEGVPLTLITEAVFARALSSDKEGRVAASKVLSYQGNARAPERARLIDQLRQALYAAKIVSYTQGYMLMRAAAGTYQWNLNYGGIAMMWRGGCIIRSAFLGKIKEAFDKNPQLENLMLDAFFTNAVQQAQHAWRKVCATALLHGIPAPALTSGLAFFDGIRTACLSANMLQAQRDYFGAHTYERVDRPRGEWFHTNWTGKGGSTASSTYNA